MFKPLHACSLWGARRVTRAGELVKGALIKGVQRWAIEEANDWIEVLVDQADNRREIGDHASKNTGNNLLEALEDETSEVVTLKKSRRVEHAAGSIS